MEKKIGNDVKKEVEAIAWQIFLNNTGLRFKKELSAEEMKKITDVEAYEHYREQALKFYGKKQRALLNKKYEVINVPATGRRGWMGGAFCLCFVYSKYNGNFILSGYFDEVNTYLKKNYTHYFYNKSLWCQGFNRDIWGFWKDGIMISKASIYGRMKGKKTVVRPYRFNKMDEEEIKAKTFYFKRLPKRWIPEFDIL